ncbi:MAG: hypothetical protein Q8P90_03405 [bacterium]|nr:hypothetical protein [bacterium]
MTSNLKNKIFSSIMWVITALIALTAIYIIYLATLQDTTLLGDPYYEDQILAHQRAFAAWAFTWFSIALSMIAGIMMLVIKKR